jgi:hypothetical protein
MITFYMREAINDHYCKIQCFNSVSVNFVLLTLYSDDRYIFHYISKKAFNKGIESKRSTGAVSCIAKKEYNAGLDILMVYSQYV